MENFKLFQPKYQWYIYCVCAKRYININIVKKQIHYAENIMQFRRIFSYSNKSVVML